MSAENSPPGPASTSAGKTGRDPKDGAGRPGYHDPLAGVGGAAPAQSALTLRLCLAVLGLLTGAAFAIVAHVVRAPIGFVLASVALGIVAAVDLAVIVRRKRRGEPG